MMNVAVDQFVEEVIGRREMKNRPRKSGVLEEKKVVPTLETPALFDDVFLECI